MLALIFTFNINREIFGVEKTSKLFFRLFKQLEILQKLIQTSRLLFLFLWKMSVKSISVKEI